MSIYFLAAAILSFNDWRTKRHAYFVSVPGANSTTESLLFGSQMDDDEELQVAEQTPWSHKVFWVMFETAFSLAIFIDVIFWSVPLYSGTIDVFVVILHALNGALMIGELFFNSLKFVGSHVVFVWFLLGCYTIEIFVWHAVDGLWAYPYLDTAKPIAYAYYPVLFVAATVTFLIGYLLVKLRDRKKGKTYSTLSSIQDAPQFVF